MSGAEMAKYIGKTICLTDSRTGFKYNEYIADVKETWGKIRVRLEASHLWFEPSPAELGSIE